RRPCPVVDLCGGARPGRLPDHPDRPARRPDRIEPAHARRNPPSHPPHRARQSRRMKVAFFGTYNRAHSANRIVAAALRAGGHEIVEIHEPLWERTRDKHAGYFSPASLVRLAAQWLRSAWRLARTWHRSGGAAVAVVGFNGQLDVLLLRMLALRHGPRIVFAPLVTLTETLVDDRA